MNYCTFTRFCSRVIHIYIYIYIHPQLISIRLYVAPGVCRRRAQSIYTFAASVSSPTQNGWCSVDYCYAHTPFYRLRSEFDMCDYRALRTCSAGSVNTGSLKMWTANTHFRFVRFAASDVKVQREPLCGLMSVRVHAGLMTK